jgi:hypothetical protein
MTAPARGCSVVAGADQCAGGFLCVAGRVVGREGAGGAWGCVSLRRWGEDRSKSIRMPEAADLPMFHETATGNTPPRRQHSPASRLLLPRCLPTPRQNLSGRQIPDLPIVVIPAAPASTSGPELRLPAAGDIRCAGRAGRAGWRGVFSNVAQRSICGMRRRTPLAPCVASLSGGTR